MPPKKVIEAEKAIEAEMVIEAKKAIEAEDIMDAKQDTRIVEIMTSNVIPFLTPITEIVVNKMTAALSEALEKMVNQKVTEGREATIKVCEEKISEVRENIMKINEEKVLHLEKSLILLEKRLEDQSIQGRSKSLIIHGLKEDPWVERSFENLKTEMAPTRIQQRAILIQTITNICQERLQINLAESDITDARRIAPSKGNNPGQVLVDFSTKYIRDRICQARTSLKTSRGSNEPRIFVNENLTQANANLFFAARGLVKNKKLSSAWTMNEYVHVKSDSDSNAKPKRIWNISDLTAWKPYDAVYKPDPTDTTSD